MAPRKRKPVKYYSPKRRAVYERGDCIDHLTLFELHGWVCYVCKERIDRNLRFPNYMAATIEHIIPLSLGGTHTWDNCAPSHAKCNFQKGDKYIEPEESIFYPRCRLDADGNVTDFDSIEL